MSKIVLANWKMNLSLKQALVLGRRLTAKLDRQPLAGLEIGLCPSFPALAPVKAVLSNDIALGAQDAFWETRGSFTSAVSPALLKEVGCRYVLLGHSERRACLGETDALVNRKLRAVIKAGLTPVLCVGETWEERRAGHQDLVLLRQVSAALRGIKPATIKKLLIAYEPVWVIGTGQAIAPAQAVYASQVIRQQVGDSLGMRIAASKLRLLYGGSVSADNVTDFVGPDKLDGVLVGRQSLKLTDFYPLLLKLTT